MIDEQFNLERSFGPSTVAFDTCQNAISAILETLGSRSEPIPVVLPINASPDTMSGVMRSGGAPILLDLDPRTLQMDATVLSQVLDEIKAAVVILTRPAGQAVDPALLELTKDCPTILDCRLVPYGDVEANLCCTFNVFDLTPVIGSGALVFHKFSQQLQELKNRRTGVLGLSANLNPVLCTMAIEALKVNPVNWQAVVAHRYVELLGAYHFPFFDSPAWPYFLVAVDNADRVVAQLQSVGFDAKRWLTPLHTFTELNARWEEQPSYPVAEGLMKKLVALPTTMSIIGKESMIVALLSEVANDT